MEFKRYAGEDGRRIEETVREIVSADAVERIQEVREEVVPMKLTKKVTTKVVSVPVEEKTEVFAEDGSVYTSVKSVANEALSLEEQVAKAKEVSMGDVLSAFKDLHKEIANLKKGVARVDAPVEAPKVDQAVVVEPVVVADRLVVPDKTVVDGDRPVWEKVLAGIGWGVAALLSAYLIYRFI